MAGPQGHIRLAYTSLSNAPAAQCQVQARAIAERASAHNSGRGITGLLALVNGRYLQILEGPGSDVEALFARIRTDAQHRDVMLLLCAPIDAPMFSDWSMGLVDRTEAAEVTAARALVIQQRLAEDHQISASDFLRWMFAPSANPPSERASKRQDAITRIAFASPGGLWNAAVLQHLASDKSVRVGRSQIVDGQDAERRALLEYADLDLDQLGTVRALSMSREPASCPLMAPMLEQLCLLVFLLGPSELAQFMPYFESWMAVPQIQDARPRILLLTSLSADRSQAMLERMRAHTNLPVLATRVKLSEPERVWAATCEALPAMALQNDFATPTAPAAPAAAAPKPVPAPRAAKKSAVAERLRQALGAGRSLHELLSVEGALEAAALCTPPLTRNAAVLLWLAADGFEDDAQMQSHAEFLQSKRQLVQKLDATADTEEIVIITRDRLHLFRQVRNHPALFLALSLDRTLAQLGAAKLKLQEVEAALKLA